MSMSKPHPRATMPVCGAKTRAGGRCGQVAMANGRCYIHGGKNPGRPVTTGRAAQYGRIFGERFLALMRDPELMQANAELALYDTYLLERTGTIDGGISAAWLQELAKAHQALEDALFVERDPARVKECLSALGEMISAGGAKQAAWEDVLGAARNRAEIAAKADAVLARREQIVTESDIIKEFVRMLRFVVEEVGEDAANRIRSRWEMQALGRIPGRVGSGAAAPAGPN